MFDRTAPETGHPDSGPTAQVRLTDLAEDARAGILPGERAYRGVDPPFVLWLKRWVPGSLIRAAPARRRLIAVLAVVVCVLVMVIGAVALLDGRPVAEPAPVLPAARAAGAAPPAAGGPPAPSTAAEVVVSVVGKVARPGLVTLPAGSRVADALRAAGGVAADVEPTSLNLARRLVDGEQVAVGVQAPAAAPATGMPGDPVTAKVDLNTATAEQLDTLPGIGTVTAGRIVAWRTQHGRFSSVEQLREVDGIGESKFEKLRDQVTVS